MMKQTIVIALVLSCCAVSALAVTAPMDDSQEQAYSTRNDLWQSFLSPPDSIRVGC